MKSIVGSLNHIHPSICQLIFFDIILVLKRDELWKILKDIN